jgi:hypothetical protein
MWNAFSSVENIPMDGWSIVVIEPVKNNAGFGLDPL